MRIVTIFIFFLSQYTLYSQESLEVNDFNLTTLKGNQFSKATIFNDNKIVVMNFWATWCGICKKEMLEINSIKDKFDSNRIKFISVSIDETLEKQKIAKEWFLKYKLSWLILFDTKNTLFNHLLSITKSSSTKIPITAIFLPNGNLWSIQQGFDSESFYSKINKEISDITK